MNVALMAAPRTNNLNGSREVIITPTVHGASNDRLGVGVWFQDV